jgi:FixJ family two-component response regulator
MSTASNDCLQGSAFLDGMHHPFGRMRQEPRAPSLRSAMRPATPPTVYVVDDDPAIRESLAAMVECIGWQAIRFGSAREFLEHPHVAAPSCVIADVNMPGIDGLELQRRVAADRPDLPVIFLTDVSDIPTTVEAMKAGAADFLLKPCPGDVLVRSIASALEDSRAALDRRAHGDALRDRYACLTPREREVLTLVVAGTLNKLVGARLGISEITVKAHRGSVMRKMKARSLADLVKMAAELAVGPDLLAA